MLYIVTLYIDLNLDQYIKLTFIEEENKWRYHLGHLCKLQTSNHFQWNMVSKLQVLK